jgi:hypothetical protein
VDLLVIIRTKKTHRFKILKHGAFFNIAIIKAIATGNS